MSENKFPPGWDRERVTRLITEYDLMDEEAQVADDEAAQSPPLGQSVMVVPTNLVPALREFIAQHAAK